MALKNRDLSYRFDASKLSFYFSAFFVLLGIVWRSHIYTFASLYIKAYLNLAMASRLVIEFGKGFETATGQGVYNVYHIGCHSFASYVVLI